MINARYGLSVLTATLLACAIGCASAIAAPTPENVPVPVPMPEPQSQFYGFIRDFRAEALKAGIMPETYDRAMSGLNLNARVGELNEKQPEFVRTVWDYLAGAVSDTRVSRGQERLAANADLFARLQETYGVPREILTAIWGLETGYGQIMGTYNLFEALTTLAYAGPRTEYGRRQLIAALRIVDEEGIDPATMTGSWAGAFGHTQFIPTTYLEQAVDGDGDGVRDLWRSQADALASAANYLNHSRWRAGESWGEEVQLPDNFAYENTGLDIHKPVSEWAQAGVRNVAGEVPADSAETATIFLPAGRRGPAFLIRSNFSAILRYNASTSYALAIGLLADRIGGAKGVQASWPAGEPPLEQTSRIALQDGLTALGFSTGGSDGIIGRMTQQAIRAYQKARGLAADGFATQELLTRILNERNVSP